MNFFKSTLIISICTLISRISGFIRDIFLAKYLGTGAFSDVFFTALKLPNLFRSIFAEGAFNSSFVPILSDQLMKQNNKATIKKFVKNIFSIMLLFLIIFTIIIEMCMPLVIKVFAGGFTNDPEKYQLIISLSRIMFPYLIFICLVSLLSGILNSLDKFVESSIMPVILNVSIILFAISSGAFSMNIAYVLSYAVLVGGFFQFAFLLNAVRHNGFRVHPTLIQFDALTKQFFKIFSNGFFSSAIIQINALVDTSFATTIIGGVSYIYYTDRLVQMPLSLIGTAIGISILPLLSKKVSSKSDEQYEIQQDAIITGLFLGLPCLIGFFILGKHIVPLLFENGKFLREDSIEVVKCLSVYAFAIPFFILTKILQSIFYSNKDTKSPLVASIYSLISNIVFNYLLIKKYSYIGIVLSTVISSCLNVVVLCYYLIKLKYVKLSLDFGIKLLKLIYPLIFFVLMLSLGSQKLFLSAWDGKMIVFTKLAILSFASGLIYLFLGYILNVFDIKSIITKKISSKSAKQN